MDDKELEISLQEARATIAKMNQIIHEVRESRRRDGELLNRAIDPEKLKALVAEQSAEVQQLYERERSAMLAEIAQDKPELPPLRVPRLKPTRQMV